MKIEEIKLALKNKFKDDKNRFKHSLRVYNMAIKLANYYGIADYEIKIAALLHDYTKNDDISLFKGKIDDAIIEKYQENQVFYHALTATIAIREDFGIDNELISSAIKKHTMGGFNMNMIDKIVLISDKIELGRAYDKVDYFRKLAFINIDDAVIEFLEDSIAYGKKMNFKIHPEQYEIIESLKKEKLRENKKNS